MKTHRKTVDYDLRLLLYSRTNKNKSCKQKHNSNNKEPHFVKEAQVEGKGRLGKPDRLWQGLLISRVSPISNSVRLPHLLTYLLHGAESFLRS
jgi:hypothetical protein